MRADKLKPGEPGINIPEEHWRKIETTIGLTEPDLPFRSRLAHYVLLAIERPEPPSFGEKGGPRLSEVRKRLGKINKEAKHLADTLSELQDQATSGDKDADKAVYLTIQLWAKGLDEDYPDFWRAIVPSDPFPDIPEEWKDELYSRLTLNHLLHEIEAFAVSAVAHLAAASEAAKKSLGKSKGGAPKDTDLDELICNLAIIYRDQTGKKASVYWDNHKVRYRGVFFDLVADCVSVFAPKFATRSNQGLGKAIQRALKKLPAGL